MKDLMSISPWERKKLIMAAEALSLHVQGNSLGYVSNDELVIYILEFYESVSDIQSSVKSSNY